MDLSDVLLVIAVPAVLAVGVLLLARRRTTAGILRRAARLLGRRRPRLALRLAARVARRNPLNALAQYVAARAQIELGEYADAARRLDDVLSLPFARYGLDEARLHLDLIEACRKMGDTTRALAEYLVLLQKDGTNPDYLRETGKIHLQRGDAGRAFTYLSKAHEIRPRDLDTLASLGEAAFRLGKIDEAAGILGKAIRLDPKNRPCRYFLGMIHVQKGEYTTARPHLEASRSDPAHRLESLYALAVCDARTNMTGPAVEAIETALGEGVEKTSASA